jgi:hypothetical protein
MVARMSGGTIPKTGGYKVSVPQPAEFPRRDKASENRVTKRLPGPTSSPGIDACRGLFDRSSALGS